MHATTTTTTLLTTLLLALPTTIHAQQPVTTRNCPIITYEDSTREVTAFCRDNRRAIQISSLNVEDCLDSLLQFHGVNVADVLSGFTCSLREMSLLKCINKPEPRATMRLRLTLANVMNNTDGALSCLDVVAEKERFRGRVLPRPQILPLEEGDEVPEVVESEDDEAGEENGGAGAGAGAAGRVDGAVVVGKQVVDKLREVFGFPPVGNATVTGPSTAVSSAATTTSATEVPLVSPVLIN